MASIEEKFHAAVNVIKNLPKNGSYQPSTAMMLTFYSYFKQATQGPCTQKKPGFWDVVGRTKWDAWNALGNMSRDRAMQLYVDELKKIIETMSFTENVADFMGSINELDNVNFGDLDLVAPEIMKKARSIPNSPFASRGNSPLHGGSPTNGYSNGFETETENVYINRNGHLNGNLDQSDDEYIDTVEDNIEAPTSSKRINNNHNIIKQNLNDNDNQRDNEILQQILTITQRMNADINGVNQRLNILERHITELRNIQANLKLKRHKRYPRWWPFSDISPLWFMLLILGPFVVQRVSHALQRRKQ